MCGVAFVWQLRQNKEQTKAHMDDVKDAAKQERDRQEKLMREMLDRDRQAMDAVNAVTATISSMQNAIEDHGATCQQSNDMIRGMQQQVRDLESEVRRSKP